VYAVAVFPFSRCRATTALQVVPKIMPSFSGKNGGRNLLSDTVRPIKPARLSTETASQYHHALDEEKHAHTDEKALCSERASASSIERIRSKQTCVLGSQGDACTANM
jgi:hypothetical protein